MFKKLKNIFQGFMLDINLFLSNAIKNMEQKKDEQRKLLDKLRKNKK